MEVSPSAVKMSAIVICTSQCGQEIHGMGNGEGEVRRDFPNLLFPTRLPRDEARRHRYAPSNRSLLTDLMHGFPRGSARHIS